MGDEPQPAKALEPVTHRRFAINTAASVCSLVLAVGVGFWYTPYMIRHLGVAVYGLLPLATSITNYLTIITAAICTTAARYITVDLARRDVVGANQHFNTFLVLGGGIAITLFLVACGFSFLLPLFFNIPSGQQLPAQAVFLSVTAAFLLSTVANTFESSIWISNRFEIRSLIESVALLTRAGLVVLLFHLWPPGLWQVVIVLPIVALCVLGADIAACRTLVPSLRVRLSAFDRRKLPHLWYTSRWVVISQLGVVLFLNIDLLLANMLLGPLATGRYAPLVQWASLLRTVALTVAGILGPPIVVRYAQGDADGLLRLSRQSSKFLGLIVALPASLLCGFSGPLLGTWLGPSFQELAPLSWLLLLPLCVEASQYHFSSVLIVADRLRVMALGTLLCGLVNIGLAILLITQFHLGLYGIAGASAFASLLRNGLLSPIYTARVMNRPRWVLASNAWKTLWRSLAFTAIAALASARLVTPSWFRLGVIAGPIGLAYLALAYFGALNNEERITLRRIIVFRRVDP